MDLGLSDKVAVVTGSSRGIGASIAAALAAERCRVCICARNVEQLERTRREIAALAASVGHVRAIQADLSTANGVAAVIAEAADMFGGIDILVNNVASAGGAGLLDTPDAEWSAAIEQTLFPAIRASRLAVPHMVRRGGGSIVMIASIYGREAGGRMTYNAVKAAQISLAKSLAQQLAPQNIRVNSVSPGSVLFEGGSWWKRQQADPEGIAEFVSREIPLGRFGTPEEVANVVAFVASPRANWINGTSVVVDGGQSRSF